MIGHLRVKKPAAHPNSRFTAPLANCPILDENWDNPEGVPISAFIYGGRRMNDIPLVFQAYEWSHGVYLAATLSSETTTAAEAPVGQLRHDPMAMIPFCGYHMADYWAHYVNIAKNVKFLPQIFHVNWFRKDKGKFLWPGFGENMRVLKWIVERANGKAYGYQTPLGWAPRYEDLDWKGLNFTKEQWNQLMDYDYRRIRDSTVSTEQLFLNMENRVPKELVLEKQLLISRL